VKRWALPLATLAALLGIWQLLADSGALAELFNVQPILVPSPSEVATALWDNRSLLAEESWVTLREIVFGLLIGAAAGLALAVLMRLSETARLAFYPLLAASQAIPVPVIAPILVIWLGFGIGPKLVIVALVTFFPITVSATDGLRSVDPEAVKMMRSLDASRRQVLWRLEAPAALPATFSGARIAAVFAPIGAVFGEWAGAQSGLGVLIREDGANLQTARLFAATAILVAIAVALFGLLALAERRVVTWR
jgi:putative hydroxymethylpyrimidine transport system permease protein